MTDVRLSVASRGRGRSAPPVLEARAASGGRIAVPWAGAGGRRGIVAPWRWWT